MRREGGEVGLVEFSKFSQKGKGGRGSGGILLLKFFQKGGRGSDFFQKKGGVGKIEGCFKKRGVLYHLFSY